MRCGALQCGAMSACIQGRTIINMYAFRVNAKREVCVPKYIL